MPPLKIGEVICDRFTVDKLLGSGGMGDVYRGHDSRLANRVVALKALRPGLLQNAGMRDRLLTEVRSLSRLNHGHIATLYDVCRHGDSDVIVMECVPGQTLSKVLGKGRLNEDDALSYAVQIADALAYAHDQGVIHRDIKPTNIIVTTQGIKLIDFGLARLDEYRHTARDGEEATPVDSTIVGTPFYMSPEQLAGDAIDLRADIYAFGLVVIQMCTGITPPQGGGAASRALISGALHQVESRALRVILEKCIAVDPADRWQNTRDLTHTLRAVSEIASDKPRPSSPRFKTGIASLAALVLVFVAVAALWRPSSPPQLNSYQFLISPPSGTRFSSLESSGPAAISPNGETVAFVAGNGDGKANIWLRRLDAVEATLLNGTEGASHPFWSPDSRSIAFFVPGKLMRLDLTGRAPRVLAAAANGRGGTWGAGGTIIFTPGFTDNLYRVSADGGIVDRITSLDFERRETSHRWPVFLPDGRRFLFLVRSDQPDVHGLYLGSLDSQQRTRLGAATSSAVYAEGAQNRGHVIFADRGFLVSQALVDDALAGEPVVISPIQPPEEDTSVAPVSVSRNGILVDAGGTETWQPLTWVDRSGRELGSIGVEGQFRNPRLSPDGKRVAMEKLEFRTGRSNLWLFDLERELQQRLILTPGSAFSPVWAADGRSLLFISYRGKQWELIRRDTTDDMKSSVVRAGAVQAVTDSSKDGQWIIYQEEGPGASDQWDVGALNVKDGKDHKLLNSPSNEHQAQLSPDGDWLAYTSNESGSDQVYLQRFPARTQRLLVSGSGGNQPKWSADGRELFYINARNEMMTARIDSRASSRVIGPIERLFALQAAPLTGIMATANYDVDSARHRFLVLGRRRTRDAAEVRVLVNWQSTLTSR